MTYGIGVPVPTAGDLEYNRQCWPEYARALQASGARPVEVRLDLTASDLAKVAADCDGFVLPGSPADVDPARYGQTPLSACAPPDRPREAVDTFLLEHAYHHQKPVLGICFGAQILNVWRGGTLIQDLHYVPVNHAAGRAVAVAHTSAFAAGSILGSLLQDSDEVSNKGGLARVPVNSSHHQAVGIPGSDLIVAARCPQDGVIEAFEGIGPNHLVIGVQWHPERGFAENTISQRLFRLFVDQVGLRAAEVADQARSKA